jgi:hypothetical protein
MPRYFFHLDGNGRLEDSQGVDLATPGEAEIHARIVVSELSAHQRRRDNEGRSLIVMDEQGNEIFRISLD